MQIVIFSKNVKNLTPKLELHSRTMPFAKSDVFFFFFSLKIRLLSFVITDCFLGKRNGKKDNENGKKDNIYGPEYEIVFTMLSLDDAPHVPSSE